MFSLWRRYWAWFVKQRLDEGGKSLVGDNLEALLRCAFVQALLDEFCWVSGNLLSLRGMRLESSRGDASLVAAALAGALFVLRSLDENETERRVMEEIFSRSKYFKHAFDSVEQTRHDLALEQTYAMFARLSLPERRDLLFERGHLCKSVAPDSELSDESDLRGAGLLLRGLVDAKSARGKLSAAEAWLLALTKLASEEEDRPGGLDELLPLAVYSMCLAAVSSLATEVAFVEAFMSKRDREALRTSGAMS
jgi:hypothetical protein